MKKLVLISMLAMLAYVVVGSATAGGPSIQIYECNDAQDNDGDGLIDYGHDPGCSSYTDDDEYNAPQPPPPPPPPIVEHPGEFQAYLTSLNAMQDHLDDPDVVDVEGVNPIPPPTEGAPSPKIMYTCWDTLYDMYATWSWYPFQNKVIERREWCANTRTGLQIWRISHVRLESSWCNHRGPWAQKTVGGNGYSSTIVRSGGQFYDCVPVGNYDRWMEWMTTMTGRVIPWRFSS